MKEMKNYRAGIDIGSTTVKLVITENERIIFGKYCRHHAHTQQTLAELLKEAREITGACSLHVHITGSGSIGLSKALGIPFTQEVVAVADAIAKYHPKTDVAIELGGEDAKIIYFTGGLDERMNGVCAGGTGSFIDQMAALLQTDAAGLNEAAKDYKQIYTIAARCGVFAKTDIQPLINEGVSKADLAASIFQSVVNQTISGLACGKQIRGCVAFLGGPLHYLSELKAAFVRTLKLTEDEIVDPENSHLFAALGASMQDGGEPVSIDDLIEKLKTGVKMELEIKRLEPLFATRDEYEAFLERHKNATVQKGDLATYQGKCFLGIDAGSTTTKLALTGENGELLYSTYASNHGNPVEVARKAVLEILSAMPEEAYIARACSTGYGEGLMKAALRLDEGEVETVAHTTAAAFFDPEVDCVLDIGGQDMKCIRLKDHAVDTVILNEACSSGCGSFIENFAASLKLTAEQFAGEALFAASPIDLGTRCTVFMNSNVKQAQKEGAEVSDISAGLAYSVIKNALFKVIKLSDAKQLGAHIVVQGGTFYNKAVLRAFEKIAGTQVICPDISGIMGAFGAALIAKERYDGKKSTMRSYEEIAAFSYQSKASRCGGCENNCMLTVSTFDDGSRFISGNRCEKKISSGSGKNKGYDMFAFKRSRIFGYEPLAKEDAPRGELGLPRVLNMYENYPYWATFFKELGFRTILSPYSSRALYEKGMDSIPSESECYPAKLSHGHVQWLFEQGIKTVFHPCVYYEYQETPDADNHYNCPMVASYAENLKNNVEAVSSGQMQYLRPFIAFTSEKTATERLVKFCKEEWNIPAHEVRAAAHKAWLEMRRAKEDIRKEGTRVLEAMKSAGRRGIVLAGRPYHIDPEINHGIPEMITSYGFDVFTEDSLDFDLIERQRPLRVVDQWVFHSRLYNAAEFVCHRDDLEFVQLFSFGCGLDAVTSDQIQEILERSGKLYTVLKIDEVSNLGATRIRIRSLIAAVAERDKRHVHADPRPVGFVRTEFTQKMFDEGYTILAPQMSPIHFDLLTPVFEKYGYHVEMLNNATKKAVDAGLKYVNNDACYPSIVMTGQMMEAVLSGRYDTDKLALLMTQTGGCCRASNYIGFIRRALNKAGLSHIPVISLNANGMEKNGGFHLTIPMLMQGLRALVLGDVMMRCLYRTRPYEAVPGSANAMRDKWQKICIKNLGSDKPEYSYKKLCEGIVSDFDTLLLNEDVKKPKVGIVGEILVKYMPLANNHLVDLLEREGAEAVVPDFMDFLAMFIYDKDYKYKYLGRSYLQSLITKVGVPALEKLRAPAVNALKKSKRFSVPLRIDKIAGPVKPFLSLGNQYGEGWFLCGEMLELLNEGVNNIVCIQPFACLPNHVMGKGVIKALKAAYPQANIAAVDYDPGASEVNQLNRIKLMLSGAKKEFCAENGSVRPA
ncbi:MAG: 2-hydroxyacyl-CoA dehydratase [Lachnospiraceae bacterium]|nr:2-hydroxyacyl-CoA dehydratase [Lachnospiraceae bacterium]